MNDLKLFIDQQEISDTHEHLISPDTLKKHKRGIIELIGEAYLHDDMISAGALDKMFKDDEDDEVRFKRILPYLDRVKNTTYYICLIEALNNLYSLEIEDINEDNWDLLNRKLMQSAREGARWYEEVLHKKGNIRHCMLDMDRTTNTEITLWEEKGIKSIQDTFFDERFFIRVARTDILLNVVNKIYRKEITELYGIEINCIKDIELLVDVFCEQAKREKAVAFKSVAAYFRTLRFEDVSKYEAEASLMKVLKEEATEKEERCVQDYIIHLLLKRSIDLRVPFQFHTGMQAVNENYIDNAHPIKLTNLFMKYKDVQFIMLHGGYPYVREAGVIAKKFPNVNIDFSFITQVSFTASKNALGEWIEMIPMSKITWGGDCRHVENSYSAILLMRRILYDVLYNKVEQGIYSEKKAINIAKNIMLENAIRIYNL